MICKRLFIVAALSAIVASGVSAIAQAPRQASTVSVLATNAIVGPLTAIADEHKKQTAQQVNIEFDTSTSINRRFAAGTLTGVHVLVAASNTIDQAIKDGKASVPDAPGFGIKLDTKSSDLKPAYDING